MAQDLAHYAPGGVGTKFAWVPRKDCKQWTDPSRPMTRCTRPTAAVRPHYAAYSDWLLRQPDDALRQKRAEADSLFHRVGITFAVYGEQEGNERLIPFDIVPRILPADEWRTLGRGPAAARAGAECLHRRHLPRPGHPAGRR